ncbi:carbohydrate esterase family 4 protein [Mycena pura]|uniref:chitin deacetylase n=1 Tax=Mycena pura TaxID=153505 RepID=A0AAD6VF06_9AGAR|nr:carbohydrate esterase family 4 protein [Mycena pura]
MRPIPASTTAAAAALLFLNTVRGQAGTEQSEANLKDPNQECAPYSYPPVAAALTQFPPIWEPCAGILPGDSAGQAKFAAMNASVPQIAPKGLLGVPTPNLPYPATDPDCWWTASTCTTPKASGVKPDIAAVPEPKTLGYGFDDGPNCSHNAFYDYLLQKEQKATMFYIGSNTLDWPLQAQRAVADGHEICVHSWSHRSMTAFTNEQVFAELWYTMQAIKLVTGYTPTCWRPPLGDVDDRVRYIAQQLGLDNVLWKTNSNDWEVSSGAATPQQVQANYQALIDMANNGSLATTGTIMLTHELNNYTMQTAIDNYPALAQAFSHIVPVFVAMNKTQLYVETNYTEKTFSQYTSSANSSSGPAAGGSSAGGSGSGSSTSSSGNSTSTSGKAAGASAGVALRPAGALSVMVALALFGALCL